MLLRWFTTTAGTITKITITVNKTKNTVMTNNTNFASDILNSAFSGLDVQNEETNVEQVNEMLDKYGLRWTVSKQNLLLPNGADSGFYGVTRNDNNKVFSTCKEGYTPYQNSELAELLLRIVDKTGFKLHSGGALNGGAKVYIQLDTENRIENLGNNKTTVKGYVSAINSHDGSTSLKFGECSFTICCQNTFMAANRKLQHSARHTESIHKVVDASVKQIHGIVEAEKTLFQSFEQLAEIAVNAENIAAIVQKVTGVDIKQTKQQMSDNYSTYAINRTDELTASISREIRQKGATLWGLFSGVTHYTTHVLPVPKRENARTESKFAGSALSIDNDAFMQVASMGKIKM